MRHWKLQSILSFCPSLSLSLSTPHPLTLSLSTPAALLIYVGLWWQLFPIHEAGMDLIRHYVIVPDCVQRRPPYAFPGPGPGLAPSFPSVRTDLPN
ncbi:uncharacterized protein BDZ83DRAFT_251227 [Colletotrichum acutatum]|uniref:Secreted protein n=1 Tax=Glomerella acutata TaxID=27357 RepID=A0AAD8XJJ3_GLOAC|nr:uncharacterized protein BDZ83DRAFT_251227 [Colletotrichum acutatum]KAK1726705.1 hypothetical protein BDZ83DRAFT_251227 [Colletotrichum acutatum]